MTVTGRGDNPRYNPSGEFESKKQDPYFMSCYNPLHYLAVVHFLSFKKLNSEVIRFGLFKGQGAMVPKWQN